MIFTKTQSNQMKRSEGELEMNQGKANNELAPIMVSVICLTYNHKKYIRKALEGFVTQKTSFRFEVIVHDDASTDGTSEIVKEYAEKYPEIIVPIIQTENQYSKGRGIVSNYIKPLILGKYVAWCEGDDQWISSEKLQRQVDFMEEHPEYSYCVHHIRFHNVQSNSDTVIPNDPTERDYSADEIICGGAIFQLSAILMRTNVYLAKPSCIYAKGFGDVPLYIYGALTGKCHVFSEVMSQYNHGTEGSYTLRSAKSSIASKIAHEQDYLSMLERVKDYYSGQHEKAFKFAIDRIRFNILILQDEKKRAKQEYPFFWQNYIRNKAINKIIDFFPWLQWVKRRIDKLFSILRHKR